MWMANSKPALHVSAVSSAKPIPEGSVGESPVGVSRSALRASSVLAAKYRVQRFHPVGAW